MQISLRPEEHQAFIQAISQLEAFNTFGVVLAIDGQSSVVRKAPRTPGFAEYIVVDVQSDKASANILDDPHNIKGEATNAALACGGVVVSVVGILAGTGAAPLTGGASMLVTVASTAALAATGASCLVGAMRTYNAFVSPGRNEFLDRLPAYRTSMLLVDTVSLIGIGVVAQGSKRVFNLLRRSGVNLPDGLKGRFSYNEMERLRKNISAFGNAGNSNKKVRELSGLENLGRRYSAQQISMGVARQLLDSIAAILSLIASARGGVIKEVRVYFSALEGK